MRGPKSLTSGLTQFRSEFHDWCGRISLKEVAENGPLMRVIERLDRMLVEAIGLENESEASRRDPNPNDEEEEVPDDDDQTTPELFADTQFGLGF